MKERVRRLSLRSVVRIRAVGGRYEKFLSDCLDRGIPLSQIEPIDEGVQLTVPAGSYRRLHRLARRNRTRLRVEQRNGIWFQIRFLRGRWGLIVGAAAFAALLCALQNLIWTVEYTGISLAAQETAAEILYEAGLCSGAWVTPELLEKGEQALLQWQEVSWAALNFQQGRLMVEAAPALDTLSVESNEPVDLIAAADGVILSVNAQEGFVCKTAGQTVAKGDVLIAAHQPDRNQTVRTAHPKGEVIARVEQTFTCEQPLRYQVDAPSGILESRYTLQSFWGFWTPVEKEFPETGEQKVYHRPVSVAGFSLPATLTETLWIDHSAQWMDLDADSARQFARYACMKALYTQYPGAQIRTSTEKESWSDQLLSYSVTVCFDADIARAADVEEP